MPSYVLKASQDPAEDLYCIYSTVVDAITLIGTRGEITLYMLVEQGMSPHLVSERLARADATGSSCRIGGTDSWYGWADHAMVIMEGPGGPGLLPRSALGAYLRALLDGDADEASALVRREREDNEDA